MEPTALVVGAITSQAAGAGCLPVRQMEPTALVVGRKTSEPTALVVGADPPIPAFLRQMAEKETPEPTALVVGAGIKKRIVETNSTFETASRKNALIL